MLKHQHSVRSSLLLGASLGLLAACSGGDPVQAPSQVDAPAVDAPATSQAGTEAGTQTGAPGQAGPGDATQAGASLAQVSASPRSEPVADPAHDHAATLPMASQLGDLPRNGRLEVDASEHDFGTAVEGEVLNHTFALKSNGEGPLVITTAKPTCGCTVSQIEVRSGEEWKPYAYGDPLAPGTELRLSASLDTKNKKSIAASKINVFCNDPRGTVTLGLTAKLDTYFNVAPASLEFGEISVADTREGRIEISARQPGAFLLEMDERTLPEGFQVDMQPVAPDAEGRSERWTVEVKIGPGAREGNLGFPISLVSDREVQGARPGLDGSMPHYGVTVLCNARVRGLISFEPQYLSFGLVRPGQVVSRTFTIKSFDPEFSFGTELPTRFAGVNETLPEFKWAEYFSSTLRPSADGKGVDVEVTLNGLPDGADGSFQGRLLVETGHAAKPEIPILFSGVCRAGIGGAIPGVQVQRLDGSGPEGGR